MPDSYDAVFVGAGHNALAAALHLAAKGWRVALFEQAAVAGGAVKTGEYTLPGFRHDWAAMNLSLFAGSAFHKAYAGELAARGAAFVPVSRPFASAFADGTWCGVSTDLEETAGWIAGHSAEDAATWRALLAEFPGQAEAIFALLGSPMKIRALAYFVFKMLRRRKL
ncbi:MAG: NAD(P)-binding protein, partial [Paracoccaceae bacterium]